METELPEREIVVERARMAVQILLGLLKLSGGETPTVTAPQLEELCVSLLDLRGVLLERLLRAVDLALRTETGETVIVEDFLEQLKRFHP